MNTFSFRTLSFSLALAAVLGLAASAAAAEPQEAGKAATGRYVGGMKNLSPEKQELVRKLHEDFRDSTKATRQELISKRHALDAQLYSANPDEKAVQALTKEISDLRAKLYSARIALKGKLIKEGVMLEHDGHGKGARGGQGPCRDAPCGGRRGCW